MSDRPSLLLQMLGESLIVEDDELEKNGEMVDEMKITSPERNVGQDMGKFTKDCAYESDGMVNEMEVASPVANVDEESIEFLVKDGIRCNGFGLMKKKEKKLSVKGSATRDLLCSSDEGFVFLEIPEEEEYEKMKEENEKIELINAGKQKKVDVLGFMYGLISKPKYSFASDDEFQTENEDDSETVMSGQSSPTRKFFSFGATTSNFFPFISYRKSNLTRSECNRIQLDYFENLELRGEKWFTIIRNATTNNDNNNNNNNNNNKTENNDDNEEMEKNNTEEEEEEEEKKDGDNTHNTCETENDDQVHEKQIERDLPRTYPSLSYFQDVKIRDSLGQVLRAISKKYPKIGYVQGMNYIGAHILIQNGENVLDSIKMFSLLIENPFYNLFGCYAIGFEMIENCVELLRIFLIERKPDLCDRLKELEMDGLKFSYNWFITLFSYTMPFEILMEIWDHFLLHGWVAIFQTSIALIESCEETFMFYKTDFEEATLCIRRVSVNPPENFMEKVKNVDFSHHQVDIINQISKSPCYIK